MKATMTCPKCLGAKRFAHLAHIENGVCFWCGGTGKVDATDRPAPPVASRSYDPANELRNLYRAARSQGRDWADEGDVDPYTGQAFGCDPAATVGQHLTALPAEQADRVLAAFAGILNPCGLERIRAAYAARLARH